MKFFTASKSAKLAQFAAAAALLSGGAAHAGAPANLVVNGSFEANQINSSWTPDTLVTGWTSNVSAGSAFEIQRDVAHGGLNGFNQNAADGVQYLELNTDQFSTIHQSITTAAAGDYLLTFAYSGRPDTAGNASSLMNVYWGGQLLTASPLVGLTTNLNTGWQTYSAVVHATSTLTELKFQSVGPSSAPTYGSYLDNVSVTAAVPEPETYAMMLLGLGLVGLVARRKV